MKALAKLTPSVGLTLTTVDKPEDPGCAHDTPPALAAAATGIDAPMIGLRKLTDLRLQKRPSVALVFSIGLHLALLGVLVLGVSSGPGDGSSSGYGEDAVKIGLVRALEVRPRVQNASDDVGRPEGEGSESQSAERPTEAVPPGEKGPTHETSDASTRDSGGDVEAGSLQQAAAVGGSGQGILEEIARCLPDGLRPSISGGELVLEFGASGGLRSAPALNGVLLSAEQRAQVDRIIQAAIQCAPYGGGHVENTTMTLVPDFAAVHPRVGVPESDNE